MTSPDEYDHTIEFLAGCFPTLATMPTTSRRLYHETFHRAVELRGGVIGGCYDVEIAGAVLREVIGHAFAELIRE
jgi:hypothetical protein